MPLILDNPMGGAAMQVDLGDVDDLFGDAVPMALPARPPSARFHERLDELRGRGSCRGIAWSKAGTVASIAPDGQSLELRYIRAHPKDASWGLSRPTPCAPWQNLLGGPIVHLSWAPTQSSELAVVDAVGRVLILTFNTNLNRPATYRRWDGDPVDDLHAVVGTYWLNTMPSHRGHQGNLLHAPIVKDGSNYQIETTLIFNQGPFHPNQNRSAFFCVTTNGLLKMFWTQNNGKVEETPHELESVTSADELVTHAAICSDPRWKCMFVALATSSKQLQVVQLSLNWGLPPPESMKGIPPGNITLNPTLKDRHVAISSWLPGGNSDSHLDSAMKELMHIEMLPTYLDQPSKNTFPPIILTVRCHVPPAAGPYGGQAPQEVQSIIDRWEIVFDQAQSLHSAFEQLGSRRNSAGSAPPNTPRLKRLDPIIVNKVIMSVDVIRMGTIVAFTHSDGTMEYRDRMTMNVTWNSVNLERIHSVHEAGFTQGGEPSCLQSAISPTQFSVVQMCDDAKVKWHPVTYTLADPTAVSEGQYSAIVAALTMSTAQATASQSSIDDILAVARQFIHKEKFPEQWVTEMVRAMRITVDYSEEAPHEGLVRNTPLQNCFSILNHLCWSGEYQPRNFRSKMAMFYLHLRNIVILITIANNGNIQLKDKTSPLDEPEVVDALSGCCKWSIDLLCWLADSLFNLADDPKFLKFLNSMQDFQHMTPYLLSRHEVALHMVLSSPFRGLLSAVCRRIIHLQTVSLRALTYYETRNASSGAGDPHAPPGTKGNAPPIALHHAYQRMHRLAHTPLINLHEFDKLLGGLGADVRARYTESFAGLAKRAAAAAAASASNGGNPKPGGGNNSNPGQAGEEAVKRAQTHCELTMLLGGSPAPPFHPVVDKFFKTDLRDFRAHTDPAGLFFADHALLELETDPHALALRRRRGLKIDLFKRVEIARPPKTTTPTPTTTTTTATTSSAAAAVEVPWRRCVRCASVMEDVTINKPGITMVLSQQRNCSCGARFGLLNKDEVVG